MGSKLSVEVRARVNPAWKDQICQLADRMALSPPDIVRQALRMYLAANPVEGIQTPDTICSEGNNPGAAEERNRKAAAPILAGLLSCAAPIIFSGIC